jgi:hypothetical protein
MDMKKQILDSVEHLAASEGRLKGRLDDLVGEFEWARNTLIKITNQMGKEVLVGPRFIAYCSICGFLGDAHEKKGIIDLADRHRKECGFTFVLKGGAPPSLVISFANQTGGPDGGWKNPFVVKGEGNAP